MEYNPIRTDAVILGIYCIYCREILVGPDVYCLFSNLSENLYSSSILILVVHVSASLDISCKRQMQARSCSCMVSDKVDLGRLTFCNTVKPRLD